MHFTRVRNHGAPKLTTSTEQSPHHSLRDRDRQRSVGPALVRADPLTFYTCKRDQEQQTGQHEERSFDKPRSALWLLIARRHADRTRWDRGGGRQLQAAFLQGRMRHRW
jgi:hypothetical protein